MPFNGPLKQVIDVTLITTTMPPSMLLMQHKRTNSIGDIGGGGKLVCFTIPPQVRLLFNLSIIMY